MISVKEAKILINNNLNAAQTIEMQLTNSVNHHLSKAVFSPINMPPFRQSAMDGYALCLNDSETYTIIDEVKAGDDHRPFLRVGEAVRIFTGAPVPDTANAVIMQEKVIANNEKLSIKQPVSPGQNIRLLGEQVKKGDLALKKGVKLTPAAIGFLASLGITEVEVFKKPSIAIVVTGNELTEAGQALTYGKIYESNAIMLLSALKRLGFNNVSVFKAEDNYQKIYTLLKKTVSAHDMVLITGGISVGDYDFVGRVLQELSVTQVFYKVKQKPGKPFFFGKKESTSVFALPGNPAAALSCFYVYVYPALRKMSGDLNFSLTKTISKSASSFTKKGDRAQFLKAILNDGEVTILEGQSSAMLHTFAMANALVYVPEDRHNIAVGDNVEVICLPD